MHQRNHVTTRCYNEYNYALRKEKAAAGRQTLTRQHGQLETFLFNEKMHEYEHTGVFCAVLTSIVRRYLGQVSRVTGNEPALCVVAMETSLQEKRGQSGSFYTSWDIVINSV